MEAGLRLLWCVPLLAGAGCRDRDTRAAAAVATPEPVVTPSPLIGRGGVMKSFAEYRDEVVAYERWLNLPPLERPGAVIFYPKAGPELYYYDKTGSVRTHGPVSFYLRIDGHGGPEPLYRYTFGIVNVGTIVSGGLKFPGRYNDDNILYEITSAYAESEASSNLDKNKNLSRAEFDLSQVYPFFDARRRDPKDNRTTIVVDSRDEYIKKFDLNNAMKEASAEESRQRRFARYRHRRNT